MQSNLWRSNRAEVPPGNATSGERGSALVWALLFSLIVSGMIVSHSAFMASNRRQNDVRYRTQPLSDTFARSGMTDALAWFRKQATQPVTSYAPLRDPLGDPPILDTLDPTIGLVREFQVHGDLWGRYEVRTDEVSDISQQRGITQAGSVWELAGRGAVYQRIDPSKPFDAAPNRIVSVTSLQAELRGIPLLPPASAAVIVDKRENLILDNGAKVGGGSRPAIVYRQPIDLPPVYLDPDHDPLDNLLPLALVTGIPTELLIPILDLTPRTWIGMGMDDLRALADYVVPAGTVNRPVRDGSVVYVGGDLLVDAAHPLQGRMLLVVQGELRFGVGNDSNFEGFVYAKGDIILKGPVRFRGTVMGASRVKIYAGADIVHDQNVIQTLKSELARYRLSRQLRETATH